MIIELDTETFESFKAEKEKVVVIDLYADWCGPCKALTPLLEELSEEIADKAVFGKIDIDENQELAVSLDISSIPTLLFFKGGELKDKQLGLLPKSTIKQIIDQI